MSVRGWPVAVARLEVSTKAYCNAAGGLPTNDQEGSEGSNPA